MDNLGPQPCGIGFLHINRLIAVDGILLDIGLALNGGLHESVVDAHRHVGTGDLAFHHFGVDKRLGIGVLDTNREHQGTTAAVLRHLAGAVAVTNHERHQTGRGQSTVLDRRPLGADV